MTARIFDLRGLPFQPVDMPSQAGPRVPGQLTHAHHSSSQEEIFARRDRARMRLCNAIHHYRDVFGSDRLAAVLINAAEDERRLSEDCR
jgi:hypothetical protein